MFSYLLQSPNSIKNFSFQFCLRLYHNAQYANHAIPTFQVRKNRRVTVRFEESINKTHLSEDFTKYGEKDLISGEVQIPIPEQVLPHLQFASKRMLPIIHKAS